MHKHLQIRLEQGTISLTIDGSNVTGTLEPSPAPPTKTPREPKATRTKAADRPGCPERRMLAGVKRLAAGGIAFITLELGADAAPPDVADLRWSTCLTCDRFDRGICLECDCHLSAKVRLKSQSCPLNLWKD
jgi:hypothetical protein